MKFLVYRSTGYNHQSSQSFRDYAAERYLQKVVFLIFESLGSTELAFILVMALVFFGPRKLPQLSRTLGKNLTNFRRASEDFKRTWEKEVSLEDLNLSRLDLEPSFSSANDSISSNQEALEDNQPFTTTPTIEPVEPDSVIPRQANGVDTDLSSSQTDTVGPAEPLPKREWL
ncbi:MAG TPA: twin-arginine translocase TatA/TatE family subunit [Pyrinomonadaceae bacterium]|nr:twin-arginine translocase TatA/TatE family subunit [Pyrinomonadaceae bacterium]